MKDQLRIKSDVEKKFVLFSYTLEQNQSLYA